MLSQLKKTFDTMEKNKAMPDGGELAMFILVLLLLLRLLMCVSIFQGDLGDKKLAEMIRDAGSKVHSTCLCLVLLVCCFI